MRRVHGDVQTIPVVVANGVHRIVREAPGQQRASRFDDARVLGVERDSEAQRPCQVRDTPITQIEREQLRIVLRGEPHRLGSTPAAGTGGDPELLAIGRTPPVEDRPAGDAKAPGDLAVVEAGLDEGEGFSADVRWMHSRNLQGNM